VATVRVIGSGGREHALATSLAASPRVDRGVVSPGNDGMAAVATCRPGAGAAEWTALAGEIDADLVVIGPEAPLVDGVADHLRAAGHTVFGPGAAAARLEGDKAYAKEFLVAAGIPTAAARTFTPSWR